MANPVYNVRDTGRNSARTGDVREMAENMLTSMTSVTTGTIAVTDDTNITAGSQSAGSNLITFADHSSMSAATASITYAVLIANTNTISIANVAALYSYSTTDSNKTGRKKNAK